MKMRNDLRLVTRLVACILMTGLYRQCPDFRAFHKYIQDSLREQTPYGLWGLVEPLIIERPRRQSMVLDIPPPLIEVQAVGDSVREAEVGMDIGHCGRIILHLWGQL